MVESMLPPEPAAELPEAPIAEAREPAPIQRLKVGLALAGGGFRASFFHLGVLRRLAELDVLRRVEVISTVSGGSIIGALYVLLLRERRLKAPGRMTRADYVALVDELRDTLRAGIRKNLRNRLLVNPLELLRLTFSPYSLGNRMARLYERHLFRDVVDRLRAAGAAGDGRARVFPLTQVRPVPAKHAKDGRVGELPGGIEAYNATEEGQPDGDAVPHLVLNATSMNAGGRFSFSSSEVGDWYLGFARPSEAPYLEHLKRVLEAVAGLRPDQAVEAWAAVSRAGIAPFPHARIEEATAEDLKNLEREITLALWVEQEEEAARAEREGREPQRVKVDVDVWALALSARCAESLVTAEFGRLRFVQGPAWYVRHGLKRTPPVSGGQSEDTLRRQFRAALAALDDRLASDVADRKDPVLEDAVMDLALMVYALRSAAALTPRIGADLDRLTIGTAVGASACFPPVFSPFVLQGLYDDGHVGRLGLTDGGVFDNAGVTALLDEHCACIIASDTGGVFETVSSAGPNRVSMLARLSFILQTDLGRVQRSFLRERRRVNRDLEKIESPAAVADANAPAQPPSPEVEAVRDDVRAARESRRLAGLAYFHIESPTVDPAGEREARAGVASNEKVPGALPPIVNRHLLARIRTDLDGFGDVEIAALANQGYALADAYVRSYLASFVGQWSPEVAWSVPPAYPWPTPGDSREEQERFTQVVRVGGGRFFRSLGLLGHGRTRTVWSFIPLLLLGGLLAAGLAWGGDVAAWAGPHLARMSAWLRNDLWSWTAYRSWPFLVWIGIAVVVLMLRWLVPKLTPQSARGVRRKAGGVGKYVPWALPWLLLVVWPEARPWVALVLAVVVLGLPLYALLNHVFFYLPFLKATRVAPQAPSAPTADG